MTGLLLSQTLLDGPEASAQAAAVRANETSNNATRVRILRDMMPPLIELDGESESPHNLGGGGGIVRVFLRHRRAILRHLGNSSEGV